MDTTVEQNDTLTQLAQNAGVAQEPIVPSLDLEQIEQGQAIPPAQDIQETSSAKLLSEFRTLPSAQGDDTKLTQQEDEFASLVTQLRGQSQLENQLTNRFGVPELEAEIRDIGADISKRRASLTSELETLGQQGFRATTVRGQEARARRQVAAEIAGLEAAQQAAMGQLQTANSSIERAMKAKYDPIREELEIQKELIGVRKDQMSRDQQKRAEKREAEITILENQIAQAQQQEQTALSQINQAVNNGFSPKKAAELTQQVIRGEIDPATVLSQVGGFQADPLERQIKQLQAQKLQKEISLIGQRTPEEIKAENEALRSAEGAVPALENKITLMDAIITSPALDSVVGTNIFSRAAGSGGGVAGRFAAGAVVGGAAGLPFGVVGAVPGAIAGGTAAALQGSKDTITGQRQELIASVEQLVSQEFLDSLIAVKERGGTFGALQKAEQDALTAAATKIGTWRIREGGEEGGKVLGYNASEASFKKEIEKIQELAKVAKYRAEGKILSDEEQAQLDEIFNNQNADPALYY